jgi:hypothetical protein
MCQCQLKNLNAHRVLIRPVGRFCLLPVPFISITPALHISTTAGCGACHSEFACKRSRLVQTDSATAAELSTRLAGADKLTDFPVRTRCTCSTRLTNAYQRPRPVVRFVHLNWSLWLAMSRQFQLGFVWEQLTAGSFAGFSACRCNNATSDALEGRQTANSSSKTLHLMR